MPISFKSERRKTLKTMYSDIVDAYLAEVAVNRNYDREQREEQREAAAVWKQEFKEMIEDL